MKITIYCQQKYPWENVGCKHHVDIKKIKKNKAEHKQAIVKMNMHDGP